MTCSSFVSFKIHPLWHLWIEFVLLSLFQ